MNKISQRIACEIESLVKKTVFSSDKLPMRQFIRNCVFTRRETASFRITNLSAVAQQYNLWRKELPMVQPYYAVKCNPDTNILSLLAKLGCKFDCATMGEIDTVLSTKECVVSPDDIIYANPAHMQHMLQYASDNNVRTTVIDSEDELYKIAAMKDSKFKLLIRIATSDKSSVCKFSKKFGCSLLDAIHILELAKELNVAIVGVSFHVGSNCGDTDAYKIAINDAKIIFDTAAMLEMPKMTIVDIGGGFPCEELYSSEFPTFHTISAVVRDCIVNFNKYHTDAVFIAEPGRFMVASSTTIATKVYSTKYSDGKQSLYIDNGIYGSFNNVVYDHAILTPRQMEKTDEHAIPTNVFGNTCDGLDQLCSYESRNYPKTKVGEWILWENMGAYTHTASFVFNGYTNIPNQIYFLEEEDKIIGFWDDANGRRHLP